jgi:LPS sulfotransferase NodH
VAGQPVEAFCHVYREAYRKRWNLPKDSSFEDYLHAVIENGSTPNGVFGVKIHAHHLPPLAWESGFAAEPSRMLPHLFPGAKYIDLRRHDRRAQAISYYLATMTNEWWRISGVVNSCIVSREAPFNAAAIGALENRLVEHQAAWDSFFTAEKIEPLRMDYETLCSNYRSEIGRVLTFLGQDSALAANLPEPRLERQADERTEVWRQELDAVFPPVTEAMRRAG